MIRYQATLIILKMYIEIRQSFALLHVQLACGPDMSDGHSLVGLLGPKIMCDVLIGWSYSVVIGSPEPYVWKHGPIYTEVHVWKYPSLIGHLASVDAKHQESKSVKVCGDRITTRLFAYSLTCFFNAKHHVLLRLIICIHTERTEKRINYMWHRFVRLAICCFSKLVHSC